MIEFIIDIITATKNHLMQVQSGEISSGAS
jgi:hypothetical protein